MLCHGVMDCMDVSDGGFFGAGGADRCGGWQADGGGRQGGGRGGDQVGLADEKEWQRLWRIMRLSEGRAAPDDMDMDEAPLEPCGEGAQAGGCHVRFDGPPVHTPGQVLGTMEEARLPGLRWTPLDGLEALRKRGIERVDDAEGAAARTKRPRVCGPGWSF